MVEKPEFHYARMVLAGVVPAALHVARRHPTGAVRVLSFLPFQFEFRSSLHRTLNSTSTGWQVSYWT